jgi:amino acid transporter
MAMAAGGEEVQRPERNLPRAILVTLTVVLGLYLLVALVALGIEPAGRLGASAGLAVHGARLLHRRTGARHTDITPQIDRPAAESSGLPGNSSQPLTGITSP